MTYSTQGLYTPHQWRVCEERRKAVGGVVVKEERRKVGGVVVRERRKVVGGVVV